MFLRPVRTSQPQGPARIDWSNPITRTLIQGVLGGSGGRMLVGGLRLINHRTAPTQRGLATKTSASQFLAATPGIASDTASFTLFLLEVVTDTAETNASVLKLGRTATTASAQVSSAGFSDLVPGNISAVVSLTGATAVLGSSSNVLTVGSVYSAALRFRNGVSVDLTVNGRLDSTYPTTALGASGGYGFYGTRSASTTPNCQSILSLVFSSPLSDAELKSLHDNPWQVFAPDAKSLWVPAAVSVSLPTLVRPTSTISAGLWVPTGAATLHETIDEEFHVDADYMSVNAASTTELELAEAAFPGGANQTLAYWASSTQGSTLTVTLKQGATQIMTRTHALTVTDTLYTQTLTAPEIALITSGAISVTLTTS